MSAPETNEELHLPQGEPAKELLEGRIWVDGCFDFFHHGASLSPRGANEQLMAPTGHAGAMVQARQLGDELYVGVHSDEDILANKGPTVMTLDERSVFAPPLASSHTLVEPLTVATLAWPRAPADSPPPMLAAG